MTRLFFIYVNIFFFFFLLVAAGHDPKPKPKPKPRSFVLPAIKDSLTGLHYTTVTIGKPELIVNLALDVRGPVVWIDSYNIGYNSTTYTPILCRSSKCKQPKQSCDCFGTYGPECRKGQCFHSFDSPFDYNYIPTSLVDDDMFLTYTSSPQGIYTAGSKLAARIPLSCGYDFALGNVPDNCHGILGLGNDSLSLVNTLVSTYKIPFKVALCLSSGNISSQVGSVFIGGGPYVLSSDTRDVTRLFASTSLINKYEKRKYERISNNSAEESYYIHVESIEVNFKTLSLNQTLLTSGTRISTTTPYTILQTSIYEAIVKVFARKAKKVRRVKPFRHCYSSQSFGRKSLLDKETPVIKLGLEGGAKWKIYGPNSLVRVKEDVVCFAFLDGGENPKTSIVIGTHQLEDVLVEFDLEASMFSFTPSLLRLNTSCCRV